MTSMEQQAFATAKARIEKNIQEIAALAGNTELSSGAFFSRYLELVLTSLDALGGAIWSREKNGLHRVAEISWSTAGAASERQKAWIEEVLTQTVETKKPCIVAVNDVVYAGGNPPPGLIGNEVAHPFFYTPVVVDSEVRLVLQVWLKQGGDPRSYADISSFLSQLSLHAANFFRGLQTKTILRQNQRAGIMVRMQEELLGEMDPTVLGAVTANFLVDLISCDLACVFRKKGKQWHLVSASNQDVVDSKSSQSRLLSQIAKALPEESSARALSEARRDAMPDGQDSPELFTLLGNAGYQWLSWCHLNSSKNSGLDFLIVGMRHTPVQGQEEDLEMVTWSAKTLAKAMDSATHFHHLPLRSILSPAGKIFRAWNLNRKRKVLAFVVLPLLLVVAGLLFPVPWKLSTDCSVVPERSSVIVAEHSGKIVEVLVREGDRVQEGELLARMEDTEFLTQIAVARQQQLRWEVEKGKAQAVNSEADRKIAELGAQREKHNIARLEYLRGRTELRSPLEGIVLTRNLGNRLGEGMEAGKFFCEVASMEGFDLQIEIRQQDLGVVLDALTSGRILPVEFILHAHPHRSFRTSIESVDSISQLPEVRLDKTVFLARVGIPDAGELEGLLKPGYTGKAKILIGREPAGVVLFRPFLHYLKMSWLP